MRFGIHVPKQRNLTATAAYADEIGCRTMQIFSGNPIGWRIGKLDTGDRDGFRKIVEAARIDPVVVHAPYLINIASGDRGLQARSRRALLEAAVRTTELGAGPLVTHAGNHMGAGSHRGVERAVRTLAHTLRRAPRRARIAVEGGAGRGTEIGVTFEELAAIVGDFPADRVGIVLDTAHLWALGYDLRDRAAVETILDQFDRGPGLERLWVIHANDSLAELGSRRDRHALWTEGIMGMRALRLLVRTPKLADMPVIFEVPSGAPESDAQRLKQLRQLDRAVRRAEK